MNNKNFVVGLFVAIAITAFISTTLWLTGRDGSEPTVNYSLFFEKNIGGLMLGGPVFYLGVEVGTVTDMTIISGDPMRIRVDIKVLESAPVDQGTYASLAFQGITGVSIINLSADPGLHEPLHKKSTGENPVIEVRDAGFSALLSKAPHIIDQLDSVLVQINEMLGEENRILVHATLDDIASLSNALAAQEEAISEIPVRINSALKELQDSLAQLTSMAAGIEPELLSAIGRINDTSENLTLITQRMETWTADNDRDMNAFLEDGLGQVPALVADARSTLREIEKLVKDLREDPSSLIYKPKQESIDVEQ
jgi:phospholipid/cholesterol/gamma-HCH transport system substrate-binding protein